MARPVAAQEHSGLQAAVAIEQAMVTAIGTAEKSVVSIARVASDGSGQRDDRELDLPLIQRPGFPQRMREINDPRDPEFVPKEFSAGVVIDAKGLILTAYHCVLKGDLHKVTTLNRKVFNTSIYAADPRSDLAVLKVDEGQKIADDDFVPIKFGDAKKLRKGQIVITLGNPFGIARDGQVSASWGIVSNLARKLGPKPAGEEPTLHQFGTLIQTDARLNWNTSGGALVNLKGEMVGLSTSLPAGAGFEQAAGYAIPIDDTFRRVVDTLKQGKAVEYGFLGISPGMIVRPEIANGRHGLVVDHVTPGGPASRAGLRGGELVTHIDGEPVYDFDDLRLLVGRFAAGATTSLTYERPESRQTQVVPIVLAKYRKQSMAKARDPIVSVE
ncbi:MAG: trypsin-like peptidase domain-containing protein, partial [Planctomycetaceae bacterium]|nr:trypsin-like peptidase domain-containing protein [Planctomycetaceae bacterium]